jgi:hypothetical protein
MLPVLGLTLRRTALAAAHLERVVSAGGTTPSKNELRGLSRRRARRPCPSDHTPSLRLPRPSGCSRTETYLHARSENIREFLERLDSRIRPVGFWPGGL